MVHGFLCMFVLTMALSSSMAASISICKWEGNLQLVIFNARKITRLKELNEFVYKYLFMINCHESYALTYIAIEGQYIYHTTNRRKIYNKRAN